MDIRFRSPFENQGTIRGRSVTARQTQSCGTVTVTQDDQDSGGDDPSDPTDPSEPGPTDPIPDIPGGSTALIGGGALLVVVVLLIALQ